MNADLRLVPEREGTDCKPLPRSIRVVLAISHPAMRRSLRALLAGEEKVEVVAEAPDLRGTISAVNDEQPGVLVVDLHMRDGGSLGLVRHLVKQTPELAIVVLTAHDVRIYARQALTAGALGFVSKQHAVSELPKAVRAAARGERYVSPTLVAHSRLPGHGAVRAESAP